MKKRYLYIPIYILESLLLLAIVAPAFSQDGMLRIRVTPREARLFVDGRPTPVGSRSLQLGPGEHRINVYNYGYQPATGSVTIESGETTPVEVVLKPAAGSLSGSWGHVQTQGIERAAALLNGNTPDYFSGHGEGLNGSFTGKEELVVPPRPHQVTLLLDRSKDDWSEPAAVATKKRGIVPVDNGGKQKTWIARATKGLVRLLASRPPLPAIRWPFPL
jgi:hypothetical protein